MVLGIQMPRRDVLVDDGLGCGVEGFLLVDRRGLRRDLHFMGTGVSGFSFGQE